ncbi:MarR family winged helix-turn-helix transcriptional regulator [Streptomyces sp. NPDC046862]|uniref:MarR family winged helix-turn-helix transcriptional regulator n=1 Tax=Streptomyces sp. NPDC046862 TaxID=3154603 RepID=UPI0034547151
MNTCPDDTRHTADLQDPACHLTLEGVESAVVPIMDAPPTHGSAPRGLPETDAAVLPRPASEDIPLRRCSSGFPPTSPESRDTTTLDGCFIQQQDGVMAARDEPLDTIHEAIILFSRNARVRANNMYDELSFVAYTMLSYVGTFPQPTASDLAERYGLEKSTVSRQLSRLEEDGLLHRVAHPSRSRTKLLQLTDTGRARLARVRQYQRKGLDERLGRWPDEDVETFSRLLWRFVTELD